MKDIELQKRQTAAMDKVLADVRLERQRQRSLLGEQNWEMVSGESTRFMAEHMAISLKAVNDEANKHGYKLYWANIILEEIYEALAETDPDKQYVEAIQAAAVLVQIAEYLKRQRSINESNNRL